MHRAHNLWILTDQPAQPRRDGHHPRSARSTFHLPPMAEMAEVSSTLRDRHRENEYALAKHDTTKSPIQGSRSRFGPSSRHVRVQSRKLSTAVLQIFAARAFGAS